VVWWQHPPYKEDRGEDPPGTLCYHQQNILCMHKCCRCHWINREYEVPGLQKLGNPGRTGLGKGELVLGTGFWLLLRVLVMDCCLPPDEWLPSFQGRRSFIVCRGMMKHRSASPYISPSEGGMGTGVPPLLLRMISVSDLARTRC